MNIPTVYRALNRLERIFTWISITLIVLILTPVAYAIYTNTWRSGKTFAAHLIWTCCYIQAVTFPTWVGLQIARWFVKEKYWQQLHTA
ncbi:MAG: hypothetical protein RLY57_744 [Candidatus Parcubacteria bacterium]|jgi:hypothetical protein